MTNAERAQLELAGIDLRSRVPSGMIFVPLKIELSGQTLIWRESPIKRTRPPNGLLQQFINLMAARKTDIRDYGTFQRWQESAAPRVLEFARRWGVLEICEHGYASAMDGHERCKPASMLGVEGEWLEPIGAWYYYAGLFRALIRIAAQVHQSKTPPEFDWQCVRECHRFPKMEIFKRRSHSLEIDRERLALAINTLVSDARVRPAFRFEEDKPELTFLGRPKLLCGLFGYLTIELMFAVSGAHHWFLCSECGHPYTCTKQPNPNRRNYCANCKNIGAWKYASKKYRDKKKGLASAADRSPAR